MRCLRSWRQTPWSQETAIDTEPTELTLARVPAVLLHVMTWSVEFSVATVEPSVGAALRLLAAVARAGAVVEIGTGLGVSGLWLLEGMRPDGVLTTVDIDPDHLAMARQSFAAAGVAPGRTRLITGSARTVLPRLADNSYDLVFVDGEIRDYPHCVGAAHRLLRDGGLLAVHNALGAPAGSDDVAVRSVRELATDLRDAPEWATALIPAGAGLLCATKKTAT
jgi:predicted O-methyltransferase YrrM